MTLFKKLFLMFCYLFTISFITLKSSVYALDNGYQHGISNTSILTSDTPAAFGFIDQYKGEILFEETNITVSDNHSIEIMADQYSCNR